MEVFLFGGCQDTTGGNCESVQASTDIYRFDEPTLSVSALPVQQMNQRRYRFGGAIFGDRFCYLVGGSPGGVGFDVCYTVSISIITAFNRLIRQFKKSKCMMQLQTQLPP